MVDDPHRQQSYFRQNWRSFRETSLLSACASHGYSCWAASAVAPTRSFARPGRCGHRSLTLLCFLRGADAGPRRRLRLHGLLRLDYQRAAARSPERRRGEGRRRPRAALARTRGRRVKSITRSGRPRSGPARERPFSGASSRRSRSFCVCGRSWSSPSSSPRSPWCPRSRPTIRSPSISSQSSGCALSQPPQTPLTACHKSHYKVPLGFTFDPTVSLTLRPQRSVAHPAHHYLSICLFS